MNYLSSKVVNFLKAISISFLRAYVAIISALGMVNTKADSIFQLTETISITASDTNTIKFIYETELTNRLSATMAILK